MGSGACPGEARDQRQVVLVHGGAGSIRAGEVAALRAGCEAAARAGAAVLDAGGTALEAAVAAVAVLEDDPLFNAGRGAVANAEGRVELDASVMRGADLAAGAVGAVRGVPNPVRLAQAILEQGRHVLLVGEGARRLAGELGVALCDPRALDALARPAPAPGTVGAVVCDDGGGLAAATSTGGLRGKLPGRVGDSALIGCGTYADRGAAVSCTGEGEAIIRAVLAREAARLAARLGAQSAAERALARFRRHPGGAAGLILVDRRGHLGMACCAPGMVVAWRGAKGAGSTVVRPATGEV